MAEAERLNNAFEDVWASREMKYITSIIFLFLPLRSIVCIDGIWEMVLGRVSTNMLCQKINKEIFYLVKK